ncbi:OmpA family protein [Mucilaginibacter ximonensis]|uniref:OmpA family protein n=1 Tax=Mucilaginibacter ximonensis TaxID=538021 RepID=A0ABW5YB06_9SPHI
MKTNLTKAVLMATGILLGGSAFAQNTDSGNAQYVPPFSPSSSFRTWSIGVNAGILSSYTPFAGYNADYHRGDIKLGYGAYIKDQLSHSWGIQADFLRGEVAGHQADFGSLGAFKTKLSWAGDIVGNFTFANISWRNQQNGIQLYGIGGVGYEQYQATSTLANGSTVLAAKDKSFYFPVGAGIKFQLSQGVNLDLGYTVHFSNADNVDGYAANGNNDKYGYAHAGLEFALGAKSKPQMAAHNPVASMRHEYVVAEQNLQSEVDAQKAQNAQLRSDLDATKASLAATNANLAKFTADEDGDGVPDFFDKCPGTPAGVKVDGSGCPLPVAPPAKVIITEEDRRIVREAIKNLEFDFGKATIRAHSYPTLERVARLLIDKNFSLKLAGHTDNVGSDDANMRLSKDRAESVKSFLVSKGANPSRIEATGYGETQPIASNKTAKGRQMNRRVEFTLF